MTPDTPPVFSQEDGTTWDKSPKSASDEVKSGRAGWDGAGPAILVSPPPTRIEKPFNTFDTPPSTPPVTGNAPPPPPQGTPPDAAGNWPPIDLNTFTLSTAELPVHGGGRTPPAYVDDPPLATGDSLTITISAERDGKLRVNRGSWDDAKIIQPGEIFEVRHVGGQVQLIRRRPKGA